MRLALVVLASLALAPAAQAGYSYATLTALRPSEGIAATITAASELQVAPNGHVAAWVGVGSSQKYWLQVGVMQDPGQQPALYYEYGAHNQELSYMVLSEASGPTRVALYEGLPNQWFVIAPAGIFGPFYLPHSFRRLNPMAAAESYEQTHQGNSAVFMFSGIQTADAHGNWHRPRLDPVREGSWRLWRLGRSTFAATLRPR